MADEPVSFRFSTKMARLLGRESVSSDTAALFELVKNGYDADAEEVIVKFENIKVGSKEPSRIIVQDIKGDGMSYNDIKDKWMVIGTYSKERKKITEKGRVVVGNKGIGRFATEKLAKNVEIISRPRGNNDEVIFKINWDEFENEGIDFTDVKVPIIRTKNREEKTSGTTIILTNLREVWDAKKIQRFQTAVSSIIIPDELQTSEKTTFDVKVFAEEFQGEIPTKIESIVFKKAPYKVSATLPSETNRTTMMIYKKGTLQDSRIIEIDAELESGQKWKEFGGCTVTFYLYPQKTKYDPWDIYYRDVLNANTIRTILKENHGIKIYRDSFWVSPYGSKGNDWLELEAARVQSNLRPGNSQVIGYVQITSKNNPEIKDTTTREKLVENTEFESLRYFVNQMIDEFYYFRKDEVTKQKLEGTRKQHEQILISELKFLEKLIEENPEIRKKAKSELKRTVKKINNEFTGYKNDIESEYNELEQLERMYRNLASLGISSAASYHEIFNVITDLSETPDAIINRLKELDVNDDTINDFTQELNDKFNVIVHFTWFIRKYVQSIGNIVNAVKKEKIHLKKEASSLIQDFTESNADEIKIKIKCFPDDLSVFMNRIDFLSIMLNLLTNSVKSLEESKTTDPQIVITFSKGARNLKIQFSDNGKGVSDNIKPKIFRPLYSSYENGTGMGLPIIVETLGNYSGKIDIIDSELSKGATFLIEIPMENLQS